MTSPEPSFAVLFQAVDGFLSHPTFCVLFKLRPFCMIFACFCHQTTFYQPGGLDHSVFDTFVQLTEGRSARDQPKQPPAKKRSASGVRFTDWIGGAMRMLCRFGFLPIRSPVAAKGG